PVDAAVVPPPIEVENLVPLEPDEEVRAKPADEASSWQVPPPVRHPETLRTRAPQRETPSPEHAEGAVEPPRPRKRKSAPRTLPALPAKLPEAAPPAWETPPPVRRPQGLAFPEPGPPAAEPMDMATTPVMPAEPGFD